MNNFTDIKIGDRVWDFTNGWGVVRLIEDRTFQVNFDYGVQSGYFFNGKSCLLPLPRTLFWDSVKIVPPPKPEQKIDKVYCEHCRNYNQYFNKDEGGCIHKDNLTEKSTALRHSFEPKAPIYVLNKFNDCKKYAIRGWVK